MSFARTSLFRLPMGSPASYQELMAVLPVPVLFRLLVGAVPVEPVKNPPSVITSDQPYFDPGTSTSGLSSGVTVGGYRFQSYSDHW